MMQNKTRWNRIGKKVLRFFRAKRKGRRVPGRLLRRWKECRNSFRLRNKNAERNRFKFNGVNVTSCLTHHLNHITNVRDSSRFENRHPTSRTELKFRETCRFHLGNREEVDKLYFPSRWNLPETSYDMQRGQYPIVATCLIFEGWK